MANPFDQFDAPAKASTPQEFAKVYGPAAERAGKALGVDPAVILGQWGLETGWGKSIVPGTNNLGNIKDFSGGGVGATDNMTGSRDKYRAYASPDAFADDFVSLIQRKYPGAVGSGADAAKFTSGLKGYAEDPNYAAKVGQAARMAGAKQNPVLAAVGKVADAVIPSAQAAEANPFDQFDATQAAKASAPKKDEPGLLQNLAVGAVRGAANIGATILTPIDAGARALGIENSWIGRRDRRQRLDEFANENADTGSLAYQGGKLGAEIAGTAPVGGLLGKAVKAAAPVVLGSRAASPVVSGLATALETGGFRVGQGVGPVVSPLLRIAGGAGTGAASAALVNPEDAGTGAVVGGALPIATKAVGAGGKYAGNALRSLVEPFTEAGVDRLAGNIVRRFGAGGPITGNASEFVPGSVPRLSEVTGNAGLGSLELGFSGANPLMKNAIDQQVKGNAAARFKVLSDLAGTEADRVAAIQARGAVSDPLYAAAVSTDVPVDRELSSLLKRPSLQSAVGRAEKLAEEKGGTFGLSQPGAPSRRITNTVTDPGRGVPPSAAVNRATTTTTAVPGASASIAGEGSARGVVPARSATTSRNISTPGNVSLAGEGAPRVAPYEAPRTLSSTRTINPYAGVAGEGAGAKVGQEVSGQDLQNLKLSMDAMLTDPTSGIAGREVDAVKDTRNALVKWMREKIPGFAQADAAYAEGSKPLAQMDIGQRLVDKYTTALERLGGDAPPRMKAEAFAQAVLDERKLLKNSKVFEGYKSLDDVFTPDQLKAIQGVADDLARASQGTNAGKTVGATTFQNISTNNILENALPGPVRSLVGGTSGPVGSLLGAAGNLIYKGANEKIQNRLMEMLMNPQSGLNALQNVGGNQLTGPLGSNALLRRVAPYLLPAGTVGVTGALSNQ